MYCSLSHTIHSVVDSFFTLFKDLLALLWLLLFIFRPVIIVATVVITLLAIGAIDWILITTI